MFSKELEEIIEAALADGVLTHKERAVLYKRAQAEGVDADELDVVIEGRLAKMQKQEDWLRPAPPQNTSNSKYGDLVKCPACESPVSGGSAVCKKCGHLFSNISANSSVLQFQARLDEFNKRQEDRSDRRAASKNRNANRTDGSIKHKMELISMFPVPNTRTDLLEFLTMLQGKIKSTGPRNGWNIIHREEDLSYAYWLLYDNCINKAKLSFKNDKDFAPYFSLYETELQDTKGIIGWAKCNPKLFFWLCVVLAYIILLCVGQGSR